MSTEYQDLDLDALLEVARSDAEHSGDMAEQARVLREMSTDLDDKVDLMHGVMATLFGDEDDAESGSWGGDSSRMMRTELDRLFTMASDAPQVLRDNAKSMDDFSTKTHDTLITIDQLHVRSKEHGVGSAAEQEDIRQAREVMRTAGDDYLSSARAMPQPEFYKGLREADPDTSADWTIDNGATPVHSSEPTTVSDPPKEPALQNPASTAPTGPGPGPGPAPAPAAPGGPAAPGVAGPFVAPPTAPPPSPGQRGGFPAPRTGPTTPAVIGPRRPPAPAVGAPRPVTPSADGTVRPVIGSRPSAVTPSPRPERRPDGTVRPVIGARPSAVSAPASHPATSSPDRTVRPVIGQRPPTTSPAASRPVALTPDGTVRPVIGFGRRGDAGARPSSAPLGPQGPGRTPAPPANGPKDLLPTRYHTARPPGGMAFGSRPRPVPAAPDGARRMSSVDNEPRPHTSKPGQRRKPLPRQGGSAVENAITRGTNNRQPRRAGQDVFATFDAARQQNEDKTVPPGDDSVWGLRQVVVPAVISPRKDT